MEKILNNNAVMAHDENGRETVVMGRGIAFGKKAGEEIDDGQVEKTFTLTLTDEGMLSRFQELLAGIPLSHMLLSERIINYAKIKLGKRLNDSIYVTLPDHISGAIIRYKEGVILKNPLIWDIKRFYRDEFDVGLKAVSVVEEETGVRFLDDEAAFIALHFVNAEMDEKISNIYDITRIMQEVSDIIRHSLLIEFDENSLNYYRFITHLKFFAQRILSNTHYEEDSSELLEVIKYKHNKAFKCVEKVRQFVLDKYGFVLSDEEMLYLTVHISRLIKDLK